MKNRLFMYLFIFTLLLVIFQFVNSKSIIENYDEKLTNYMEKNTVYKDSIQLLKDREASNIYSFNFETNDDAMTYIENEGFKISEFIPFIKDELYELNVYDTEDHPLVPYASMTENKMLIDQVRMLNHKWIIASFTDGTYWGEMLLSYEVIDKKELRFKVLASTMYMP
ncbi:hypothetical protein [Sediminibacter sp. Hel_I_10]|uniref:hypothetical protein n=1 Tax=Sediminibacter sp. Hel_I_10 TaxID=1392490 RepID=UPI00047C286B|nr:hypothetical protein [Sediminibacter sp. Hel_I_10]